jgi:hypothetical protein
VEYCTLVGAGRLLGERIEEQCAVCGVDRERGLKSELCSMRSEQDEEWTVQSRVVGCLLISVML